MNTKIKKILIWISSLLAAGVLVSAGLVLGWRKGLPLRLVDHFSLGSLQEDAIYMEDCLECHTGEDHHRCTTCHDEHGAVEFADLPFYNLIALRGDVPRPGFIEINQITPDQDHPGTYLKLLDFLADQGVKDFLSVTLTSRDGGFVTVSKENITEQALLLPYMDGIRFAAEDLHVSTWLKGITGMIVVGEQQNLVIHGEPTSPGRLLLGPTRLVIVENARVMFASKIDGEIREAETAARVWGAALSDLVPMGEFSTLIVRDGAGEEHRYSPGEIQLATLVPQVEGLTLVFPGEPRSVWVKDVIALDWEE